MNNNTLPVFSVEEMKKARLYLATQVAEMMGRKLEEGDWGKIYCEAKGIPSAGWSNTDIDIMFGNIGVEQKMICRRAAQPIKESCGTTIMHPAGTRAIRIPPESYPTKAAQNILQQYADLFARRKALVRIVDLYNNGRLTRPDAVRELQAQVGYSKSGAEKRVPLQPVPSKNGFMEPDLRTGWLLWQDTLREFLYFEEPMIPPQPANYVAEWKERAGSGSRIGSRNLWIYEKATGDKHFSVTTEAGAKVQPYFRVPNPNDPHLYYFVAQGESCGNGLIRVWLTEVTANLLRQAIGNLSPGTIAAAVEAANYDQGTREAAGHSFGHLAIEVLIPEITYERLTTQFHGVSDEHNFKQLVDVLLSG